VLAGMLGQKMLERRVVEMVVDRGGAGTRPTWMPGAVPKVEPADWVQNRYGRRPKSVPANPATFPGGVWRTWMEEARRSRKHASRSAVPLTRFEYSEEGRQYLGHCTPIRLMSMVQEIQRAREGYMAWWQALHKIREALVEGKVLRLHTLTKELPPAMPWRGDGEVGIVETGPRPDWRR
jgi:hypothetical protein